MRKIGKVLFFKIIAICVSICLFVDIAAYAVPNLRVNSMFDEIDKLEQVGRAKRLKLYLKKLLTGDSDIRKELIVELRKTGLIIDKVNLLKTKQLNQLLEKVRILPPEHVKVVPNINVKRIAVSFYRGKSKKKPAHIDLGRLTKSIDNTYTHETGHGVEAELLEQEILDKFRQISWKKFPEFIAVIQHFAYALIFPYVIGFALSRLFNQPYTLYYYIGAWVPTAILGVISNFIPWIPSLQHEGWIRKVIFKRHFISFYAGTNISEDFAETYQEYIVRGDRFRKIMLKSELLHKKYEFMKEFVFNGKEYGRGSDGKIIILTQSTISDDTQRTLTLSSTAVTQDNPIGHKEGKDDSQRSLSLNASAKLENLKTHTKEVNSSL